MVFTATLLRELTPIECVFVEFSYYISNDYEGDYVNFEKLTVTLVNYTEITLVPLSDDSNL